MLPEGGQAPFRDIRGDHHVRQHGPHSHPACEFSQPEIVGQEVAQGLKASGRLERLTAERDRGAKREAR